jgi:branched-chain amino acid transport system permease protein
MFMLGGVLTVVLMELGLPLPVAALTAIAAAALAGAVIERAFVRPFNREANAIGWMLTTIAVGIMIEASTTATYGPLGRPLPTPLVEQPLRIGGSGIYPQELLLPVAAVAATFALEFFYRRTVLGRAMRAVSFNRVAAGLVGIDADRITLLAFAIAGGLGAFAGFLIAPVIQASASMGVIVGLKGFMVAIIAGIANARGVVVVGILYGVAEKLIEGYLSTAARDAIGFTLMILLLLLFPQGLFGRPDVRKV